MNNFNGIKIITQKLPSPILGIMVGEHNYVVIKRNEMKSKLSEVISALEELIERYDNPQKYRREYHKYDYCPLCRFGCSNCPYTILYKAELIRRQFVRGYLGELCADVGPRIPYSTSGATIIRIRKKWLIDKILPLVKEHPELFKEVENE